MSALEDACWRVILAANDGHGIELELEAMAHALVEQQRATSTVVESCLSCGAPALIPHVDVETGVLCDECYDASVAAWHHDKPQGD